MNVLTAQAGGTVPPEAARLLPGSRPPAGHHCRHAVERQPQGRLCVAHRPRHGRRLHRDRHLRVRQGVRRDHHAVAGHPGRGLLPLAGLLHHRRVLPAHRRLRRRQSLLAHSQGGAGSFEDTYAVAAIATSFPMFALLWLPETVFILFFAEHKLEPLGGIGFVPVWVDRVGQAAMGLWALAFIIMALRRSEKLSWPASSVSHGEAARRRTLLAGAR